jgi:hypothetical protein
MTHRVILGTVSTEGTRVANKRKSIKWALKKKRLLRSLKLRISPRAVRLSIAFEKAHKREQILRSDGTGESFRDGGRKAGETQ